MSKMWTIDKQVDFCYGHRVWSQVLDTDYTARGDSACACRHIHGHQGTLKVKLQSTELTRGMVVDFKMMGWFKDFVDDELDHKFIMDINDPLIPHEIPELVKDGEIDFNLSIHHSEGFWTPDLEQLGHLQPAVLEKYEGLVLVDFIPTSENLASWLMDVAQEKMSEIGIDVVAVDFWETPKSHCHVEYDNT